MKKLLSLIISLIFVLIFFAVSTSAQWFTPLDCIALDNSQVVPKIEFNSPTDICFYGTGFTDGNVTVTLDGHAIVTPITNNILTSLNGFRFTDIPTGDYVMRVETTDGIIEYPLLIEVGGGGGEQSEVPEFSIFGMGAIILVSGLFIAFRRRH